jgi:uncharacterized protein (TIGR03086 family)
MNTSQTTSWPVLLDAHSALRRVVESVNADQWDAPTPCDQWTVTQVLQHAAGDQLAYAAALGGPGPDGNPFAPSGQLTGSAAELLEPALRAAATALAAVAAGATDVANPLPQGPMAAETVVGACALDAAVHAWDIATATGQPSPLSGQLATRLMPVATAIVEPLRQYGAYAAALAPEDGDDASAALLRFLGRRPA